jgi:DNA-binding NarL/FixJ family response regulator
MGNANRIGVLVVDDHPVMRDGLRFLISYENDMVVIGEAGDGAQAIDQCSRLLPDVVLMDLQMPRLDGLQAIESIHASFPHLPIVVLTTYPGDARAHRAIMIGATSYILKTAASIDIVTAIRGAVSGRAVLTAEIERELATHRGMEVLSPREVSVLRLVAAGKQNRRIGVELHVSEQTVKSRIKNILSKLNATSRTHAVTIAARRGFLDSLS